MQCVFAVWIVQVNARAYIDIRSCQIKKIDYINRRSITQRPLFCVCTAVRRVYGECIYFEILERNPCTGSSLNLTPVRNRTSEQKAGTDPLLCHLCAPCSAWFWFLTAVSGEAPVFASFGPRKSCRRRTQRMEIEKEVKKVRFPFSVLRVSDWPGERPEKVCGGRGRWREKFHYHRQSFSLFAWWL